MPCSTIGLEVQSKRNTHWDVFLVAVLFVLPLKSCIIAHIVESEN